MAKLVFYGSLRRAHYNHRRMKSYQEDGMIFEAQRVIPGFKMYETPYGYPFVVKAAPEDTIVVELFDVSEGLAKVIANMELGAGYIPETVHIDENEYTIYVYRDLPKQARKEVPGGDWTEYQGLQEAQELGSRIT